MEYWIGITLALGVSLGATAVRLDRERAFYSVQALAIGTYYVVFAVVGGSTGALLQEIAAYSVVTAIVVIGFRTNLWLVVVALVGHGIFDIIHAHIITNDGVPDYWPMFCMSYDVMAGLYLALILLFRSSAVPTWAGGRSISSYVRKELDAAGLEATPEESFRRLERAHVLSQVSTSEHVRVHWHMLVWGLRQRNAREIMGQLVRILGALTKTALGFVPKGNTGGANVSPFKPMPIPDDLAEILDTYEYKVRKGHSSGAGTAPARDPGTRRRQR